MVPCLPRYTDPIHRVQSAKDNENILLSMVVVRAILTYIGRMMMIVRTVSRVATQTALAAVVFCLVALTAVVSRAAEVKDFVGEYSGSVETQSLDGSAEQRDLSVTISQDKDGFSVEWSTITFRPNKKSKRADYKVDFIPAERDGLFAAAMRRNVFGHAVQLDPMKGEPFVWARIDGQTLTVYSLFVDETGGYEMQQFDRTLAEGGLDLHFKRFRNGETLREIVAFLARE